MLWAECLRPCSDIAPPACTDPACMGRFKFGDTVLCHLNSCNMLTSLAECSTVQCSPCMNCKFRQLDVGAAGAGQVLPFDTQG